MGARNGACVVRNASPGVEPPRVRRFFALVLFAVLASAPALAATVPPVIAKPSVIVYPFSASGATLDREASSRLATVMAQEIGLTGQVTMLPPKPGIDRQDFLAEARAAGSRGRFLTAAEMVPYFTRASKLIISFQKAAP